MQHNVILPTESKKGKKLGPRKNKTIRTTKPQDSQAIIRQTQAVVIPNVAPLNLASSQHSQDSQSVASEDSWVPQVSCLFTFMINYLRISSIKLISALYFRKY